MWQEDLQRFAEKFQHPAWGVVHSRRVCELALTLAQQEGLSVDRDLLVAASYLHDLGAFEPYKQAGVDHAERSAQLAASILAPLGFPTEQVPPVEEIIRGHMFSAIPTARPEAIVFHDADVLDFMGTMGIARLLSVVGLSDWTPDLPSAIKLIDRFHRELPEKLITAEGKRRGKIRQEEMAAFLAALSAESSGFQLL